MPVLERFTGGTWSGTLRYTGGSSKPADWDASVHVRDTQIEVPGLAEPVKIATADVRVLGERLDVQRMRVVVDNIEAYGDYSWIPGDPRPNRFSLVIPSADLADVERVLTPTLQRSSGFFARTLRLRAATPAWLKDRKAEGTLRIGTLTAGEAEIKAIRSRVLWNGTTIQLAGLEARIEDGIASGTLTTDLSRPEPRYRLSGKVRNLRSKFDVTGEMTTSGIGLALLANIRAEGKFQAHSVGAAPESFGTVSGAFDLGVSRTGPQLKLSGIQAAMGRSISTERAAPRQTGACRSISRRKPGPSECTAQWLH